MRSIVSKKGSAVIAIILAVILISLIAFIIYLQKDKIIKPEVSSSKASVADAIKEKVQEKTNEVVDKEIQIPERLQEPLKIILGIDSNPPASLLITAVVLFIVFLFLWTNSIALFSPFNMPTAVAVGIGMTMILGAIGAIRGIANLLLNVGESFRVLESWNIVSVIIAIVAIILISWPFIRLLKKRREHTSLERAHEEGLELAVERTFMRGLMDGTRRMTRGVGRSIEAVGRGTKKAFDWATRPR